MSDTNTRTVTNQVFGLAILTTYGVAFVIITLLFLSGADAVGAVVFSLITGTVTYLVWRFDKMWSVALGLVITIAIFLLSYFTVFSIFQVFSPMEFITGVLFLFGILFALIGGGQAMVRKIRKRDRAPGGSRLRTSTLTVIGLASVVSIVGFLFSRETVSAADAEGATVVEMEEFEFVPGDITVAQGDTLLLTNGDGFAHDFTLDAADIYEYYSPGSESLVDLSGLEPGQYEFWCQLHTFDGEGMTGTLTIEG